MDIHAPQTPQAGYRRPQDARHKEARAGHLSAKGKAPRYQPLATLSRGRNAQPHPLQTAQSQATG